MYVMYMVINTHGATDSKGTIWTLRQHPIKWDKMSQSGKVYSRDVQDLEKQEDWRGWERENEPRLRRQAGVHQREVGEGRAGHGWGTANHKTNKLSKGNSMKGLTTLKLRLKINADPWLRDKGWAGMGGVKGEGGWVVITAIIKTAKCTRID